MRHEQSSSNEVRLGLGGLVLSFVSKSDDIRLEPGPRWQPFVTDAPPDLSLDIHRGPAPFDELPDPVFDSGANWVLYRVQDRLIFRIRSPKSDPHQFVSLDPDLVRGDIYCVGELWDGQNGYVSPLGYPLEEVLIVNLLARGRGVLLHASAVRDGERGLLFSGVSGAGKSTMASLWVGRPGVKVLSDDRVIVREREGRFWAYGTPWHGSARISSPEAVPLDTIYVLRHAGENRAAPLQPLDAASRLLVRSFPTFWDSEGMAFTLRFLANLCQRVPCHDLGFTPEERIVDLIRGMIRDPLHDVGFLSV